MNRMYFLKLCGYTCLGATFPVVLSGCASIHYVEAYLFDNRLQINKKEFIAVKKDKTTIRPFIVISVSGLEFPIALYRASDTQYVALWPECTHQNCEVNPRSGILVCPCHGSEYDISGIVLNGPAENNLKSFNVTTDHENIYVHLS